MMIGGEVLRYTLSSKNVLTTDEAELYELTQLAGIITDPSVFKIILDLLKLNIAPAAIVHMIKSMSGPVKRSKSTPTKPIHVSGKSDITATQNVRQPARLRDMQK